MSSSAQRERRRTNCRHHIDIWARWLFGFLCVSSLACESRREPPGGASPPPRFVEAEPRPIATSSSHEPASIEHLGQVEDNLPFAPTGEQLGSIAWRTWIYTDTGPRRTRYGYLRAGAIVDRRGPPIVNEGCSGGWYRINPRGFVCIGKGATLDLSHPVLRVGRVRAERGAGLPYRYVLSRENAPYLYVRLPTEEQMRRVEGGYRSRAANWVARARHDEHVQLEPEAPAFLRQFDSLPKPYGVTSGLHVGVHAGKANAESGFALLHAFLWEGRAMGLTTEQDLIALDRTEWVDAPEFRGVALGPEEDLPVAIARGWVTRYSGEKGSPLRSHDAVPKRTVLKLNGKTMRDGSVRYWQTQDDYWIADVGVRILERRNQFPSVATGTRKWIDIALRDQTLVAYTGRKADYVTLISSGAGGLGDPEEVPATVQGTFMIHSKHVSSTMDGEDDKSDSFELRDVPFVQYFHKGYALHAAYWHNDFGRYRSHGCVNLSPWDAAWLFEWTDPFVPEGWHAVLNKQRGTVVHIHP